MRADAKARKFDRIVAIKIDRIGRSVIHLHEFFSEIESYGVAIEITDQPIDTSSPMGRFTLTILGGVAELERELISDRTKDGLRRTVANGTKLGRKVRELSPYQIEKIKHLIAANPQISGRELASHFDGISRNTFLKLAKAQGLIQ
jgi:DNA invertase Pin-like site-specific DNA recombinase